MSSKLVKKLLNQTNTQLESNDDTRYHSQAKSTKDSGGKSRRTVTHNITKEEAIQGHIQSILRLDNLVHEHTSTTAQKSFTRRSSDLKLQAKNERRLKKSGVVGASNSRSSSSSFSKQRQQPTFNKERAKRKKDEEYYSDIARALKKAKKRNKK